MATLKCDICGGNIVVQAGGQTGECANCGAAYSLERMREIVTGVKVSQTGTAEDVEQWRALLSRYYQAGDFAEAERIVKKILEAVPTDEDAGQKYDELQVLKHITVNNGVLVSYTGGIADLTLPPVVTAIGDKAFKECTTLQSIVLPEGVVSIGKEAFAECRELRHVTLPNTLTRIVNQAFRNCTSLQEITVPGSVTLIDIFAFSGCTALRSAVFQSGVTTIGDFAFEKCKSLQRIVVPGSITFVGELAFTECPNLTDFQVEDAALPAVLASSFCARYADEKAFPDHYLEPLISSLRQQGRCTRCGRPLSVKGTFFRELVCIDCPNKYSRIRTLRNS